MLMSLALPTLVLMTLAVLVTRGVEALMPESVPGLIATALLSALLLWALATGLFALLYLWQDARISALLGDARGWAHMSGLGASAALIWAPLMLLTVATAPRRWKTAVW